MTTTFSYRPGRYFVVTFLATYVLWFFGAWASFHAPDVYMPLMLSGLVAPLVVSWAMVLASGDPALRREHVDRLYNLKRVAPSNLPVFFLVMPVAVLISIGLSVAVGGSPDQFALAEGFSFSTGAVPVLVVLLLAAAFEELGWRGYAFDSLEDRFGFARASLLFGVLWSAWHLPLIFVKDSYQYDILRENVWYAVNFFAGIIPMGVIISWICRKNGRSVAATIVFHFVVNMSQEALAMTQATKCIETGVVTLIAAGILLSERRAIPAGGEVCSTRRWARNVAGSTTARATLVAFVALAGAVVNGAYAAQLLTRFADPSVDVGSREVLVSGIALQLAWAALLLWVVRHPLRGRVILLFTGAAMLLGNALRSYALVRFSGGAWEDALLNLMVGLGIAALFGLAYRFSAPLPGHRAIDAVSR